MLLLLAYILVAASVTVQLHPLPAPADGFWSAIHATRDGKVYVGLCRHGGDGHLLQFDPEKKRVRDLGAMPDATRERGLGRQPQSKIHTKIQEGADGRVYFATHLGNWWYHAREHEATSFPGSHWLAYDPKTDRIEDFGIGLPNMGGVITLTMDTKRHLLYGMTFPYGRLVQFDPSTKKARNLGRLNNWNAVVRTLVTDRLGRVWGSADPNRVFRYDPATDRLEFLPVELPSRNGLEPSQEGSTTTKRIWRVAILSRDGKKIYGIQTGGVDLFELDIETLEIRKLAQMCPDEYLDDPKVPYATLSLTEGLDGVLYYAAEGGASRFDYYATEGASSQGARAHLITYDPKTGQRKDHGQLRGPNGEVVVGTEGATTAPDGTIYFVGLVATPAKSDIQLISYRPGRQQ